MLIRPVDNPRMCVYVCMRMYVCGCACVRILARVVHVYVHVRMCSPLLITVKENGPSAN